MTKESRVLILPKWDIVDAIFFMQLGKKQVLGLELKKRPSQRLEE